MCFKKLTFAILIITLCVATLPGQVPAETPVQFSWAVLTDTDKGLRPIDFSTPPTLANGMTIQFYIAQKPGTYIYIYLIDSADNLEFLFPGEINYYNSVAPAERIFRIPADTDRFELTPPGGQEKLYLLASSIRLVRLEKLTAAFLENPKDPVRKASVINELKKIRRRHSKLAQSTETSVPVAGTIRSRGVLFDSFEATKVNAPDFYSRILRINHE